MSVKSIVRLSASKVSRVSGSAPAAKAWRTALCLIGLAAATAWTVPAQATVNLVQNGQFLTTTLTTPGGFLCTPGAANCGSTESRVADWTSNCAPGLCGTGFDVLSLLFPNTSGSAFNGGIGLYSIANSPDGGNFVAIDGDPRFTAPLLQTISGLTVGREYQLSFLQASGQQKGDTGITAQQWNVTFGGGVGQLSTLMLTPSQGSTPWTLQTMDFTASSASEVLNFMASGVGAPPVALLADVSLTAIPEPTTWVLMALGFGGLGLAAYRRTKKVAALAD
jgi:hypothetical protein